eukprot:4136235-Pyramimonas_sp.AAC.1
MAGHVLLPLFHILSGIVQGCPGSGALYALASHPFLALLEDTFEERVVPAAGSTKSSNTLR